MTKSHKANAHFIELYRRKLRRELEVMGYPGAKAAESTVQGHAVDAGEKVRLRSQDPVFKKRRVSTAH